MESGLESKKSVAVLHDAPCMISHVEAHVLVLWWSEKEIFVVNCRVTGIIESVTRLFIDGKKLFSSKEFPSDIRSNSNEDISTIIVGFLISKLSLRANVSDLSTWELLLLSELNYSLIPQADEVHNWPMDLNEYNVIPAEFQPCILKLDNSLNTEENSDLYHARRSTLKTGLLNKLWLQSDAAVSVKQEVSLSAHGSGTLVLPPVKVPKGADPTTTNDNSKPVLDPSIIASSIDGRQGAKHVLDFLMTPSQSMRSETSKTEHTVAGVDPSAPSSSSPTLTLPSIAKQTSSRGDSAETSKRHSRSRRRSLDAPVATQESDGQRGKSRLLRRSFGMDPLTKLESNTQAF